jgi:hypothetical protein
VTFGKKTIGCLRLAAMHDEPHTYVDWEQRYQALCFVYSEKAVLKKMEDLANRDYIDYGVSARTGWLTDKGRAALAEHKAAIWSS